MAFLEPDEKNPKSLGMIVYEKAITDVFHQDGHQAGVTVIVVIKRKRIVKAKDGVELGGKFETLRAEIRTEFHVKLTTAGRPTNGVEAGIGIEPVATKSPTVVEDLANMKEKNLWMPRTGGQDLRMLVRLAQRTTPHCRTNDEE
jgi:hypothetical protein